MLTLTIKWPSIVMNLEYDRELARLKAGDVVGYVAHVVGGNVRVKLPDGRHGIIDPNGTEELGR